MEKINFEKICAICLEKSSDEKLIRPCGDYTYSNVEFSKNFIKIKYEPEISEKCTHVFHKKCMDGSEGCVGCSIRCEEFRPLFKEIKNKEIEIIKLKELNEEDLKETLKGMLFYFENKPDINLLRFCRAFIKKFEEVRSNENKDAKEKHIFKMNAYIISFVASSILKAAFKEERKIYLNNIIIEILAQFSKYEETTKYFVKMCEKFEFLKINEAHEYVKAMKKLILKNKNIEDSDEKFLNLFKK